jgi:hypothetical protein
MAVPWKYERQAASCLGKLSLTRPMGHWIDSNLHETSCCAAKNYHTNWCLKCSCPAANSYLDQQIQWENELFERWYATQVPWWSKIFRDKEKKIYAKQMWVMSSPPHTRSRKYVEPLAFAS